MKRIKLILAMILGLTALSAVCHADGRIIPPQQLPAAIQQFVQQHFPEATIAYAEKEIRKYEVHLNDGTELDFSRKGVWDKVDCKFKPVPAVLSPSPSLLMWKRISPVPPSSRSTRNTTATKSSLTTTSNSSSTRPANSSAWTTKCWLET